MFLEFLQMMIFKIRDGIVGFINGMLPLLLIVVLIYTIINADHTADEIEFRLRRSIWAIEDLIYWYAEHDWNTEELERQIFEKIDQLIALYIEKGWDMSELEKNLVNLERRLESL